MKNKFGAPCKLCGKSVAPGIGIAYRDSCGRWVVCHAICPKNPNKPVESV